MKLENLMQFINDEKVLNHLLQIKMNSKKDLATYLKHTMNVTINPDSIFDIQIKRLHEYKRQQMNLLYITHLILRIRQGYRPTTPITFLFRC